jgi:SAM-dependent methyltransferase
MADDISLKQFTAMDRSANVPAYIAALEAFDAIPELQELKALGRERGAIAPGKSVLDVGCGFGLETLRLAALAKPGRIVGIDKSADFIADARARAAAAGLAIECDVGDAEALPYPDASFDCVRAERLLIYLSDPAKAVAEMKRVAKPGGSIAIIEPDFGTTDINLPNRPMVRRALAHEADTAVVQSWLPGPLLQMLRALSLADIQVATRVVIFPHGLAAEYYAGVGQHAAAAGAITADELKEWLAGLDVLKAKQALFGTVGYFLFTARV